MQTASDFRTSSGGGKITPASTPNNISHILMSLTILTSNNVPAKNIEGKTK